MAGAQLARRISVIIPAFNAAATLKPTLRTIAAQTLRPLEVILVDDGSTDDTADIARSFRGRLPNLQVISRPNRGLPATRNDAIVASRGEFIAPIDADDLWHPHYLEKLQGKLDSHPEAGLAYSFVRRINSRGKIHRDWQVYGTDGWALYQAMFKNFLGCGSNGVFRRSILDRVGYYDETSTSCEDMDLLIRCAAAAPVVHVPEYLVGYREVSGSISKKEQVMYEVRLRIVRRNTENLPAISRQAARWVIAESERILVAKMAQRKLGHRSERLRYWLQALSIDPRQTAAVLLARSEPPRPPVPYNRQPFLETDPTLPSENPLGRLASRRMQQLAALDRARGRTLEQSAIDSLA